MHTSGNRHAMTPSNVESDSGEHSRKADIPLKAAPASRKAKLVWFTPKKHQARGTERSERNEKVHRIKLVPQKGETPHVLFI